MYLMVLTSTLSEKDLGLQYYEAANEIQGPALIFVLSLKVIPVFRKKSIDISHDVLTSR
jgi:hypothetical protein